MQPPRSAPVSTMRQCEECGTKYDDSVDVCPLDGAAVATLDLLVGHVIDGKYRIDDAIGSGAMGTVYRATQLNLDRTVALKVVRGEIANSAKSAERFKREALAIARLRHPHIVTIYDFGVAPDLGAYLVMEYLEGHSLQQEIRRLGQIPVPLAAALMRQVCSAVHAAHCSGVIHRDLKPQNIHLEQSSDGPVAKVLDFGVAKLQNGSDADITALTASGAMLGTPLYISPEQCSDLPLDARSDVYSLGCVFFEMLTGRPPFTGPSVASVLVKQMREQARRPSQLAPEIPPSLDAVVLMTLSKLPGDRYQSAAELGLALAPFEERPAARSTGENAAASGRSGELPRTTSSLSPVPPDEPTNLPQQVTSFVGREAQTGDLAATLRAARLVTLVGPGGAGKTRLAVEVASGVLPDHPDGVWFVELDSVENGEGVDAAAAAAVGLEAGAPRTTRDALREYARNRRVLFVLDSCERAAEAAARFAESILHASPGARVLATSREALGIVGERVWQVPPLSLPEWRPGDPPAALLLSEAVRLLVERVRLSKPSFELTEQNAPAVAELVRRLDGLPLAIELAASRAKVLTVEQILAKIGGRFHLLAGGGRTTAPRHRTLLATLDWSHDMLGDPERAMLRRLAVFAGGWTLAAAEAVCGGGPVDPADALDLLTRLVDRSLVMVGEHDDEARYRMLESVREYGLEKLVAAGEGPELAARHRAFFVDLAEAANRDAERGAAGWYSPLEAELENFRAALASATGAVPDPGGALRLAAALGPYWEPRGVAREGLDWLEAAIGLAGAADGVDAAPLARAHFWAGSLALELGDRARAVPHLELGARLAGDTGDERGRARALDRLAAAGDE